MYIDVAVHILVYVRDFSFLIPDSACIEVAIRTCHPIHVHIYVRIFVNYGTYIKDVCLNLQMY